MEIVGQRFSPLGFKQYLSQINLRSAAWRGKFVVLHNTGSPTIAERPQGFTHQHMLNLKSFYEGKGWHAGPHLFIDQNGIWVFSPLGREGVHAPSWNHIAYGVEMLGDFESEQFGGSDVGQAIRANAVAAIAILSVTLDIDSHSMRLHKEDPLTDHKDCPGKNVSKDDFIKRVHDYIVTLKG